MLLRCVDRVAKVESTRKMRTQYDIPSSTSEDMSPSSSISCRRNMLASATFFTAQLSGAFQSAPLPFAPKASSRLSAGLMVGSSGKPVNIPPSCEFTNIGWLTIPSMRERSVSR